MAETASVQKEQKTYSKLPKSNTWGITIAKFKMPIANPERQ